MNRALTREEDLALTFNDSDSLLIPNSMRKLIIALLVLGLLGVAAYGGRRGYRSWKTHRAVSQAREAFAKSDNNAALLWLRAALKANGNNVEAVRMMGDFAELTQSPASVAWRSRLVELESDSVTNRLLLARVAISHREYAIAKKALDSVNQPDRKSADYQKISGAWAVATGQFEEAETHFQEAMKLEPNNPVPQVNLAMILVQRADPQLAVRGRQMLEKLQTDPTVRLDALRHLAFDAFRHTNNARALAFAGELIRETNTIYNDRILHLNLLVASKSPQLPASLAGYQKDAATNAQHVFELSRWMLGSRGSRESFAWLQSISPRITTNLPVALVVADTYMGLTNWAGLQGCVSKQQWGELDYLRLMFLSRALREQGFSTAAKAEWSKALKEAAGQLERLKAIQGVTANWAWGAELEEVLWLIVNKFPTEKGAVQALSTHLYVDGKTRSLLTLYAQEAKLDPGNLPIKNNLVAIALLLNSEQHKPHELARELYEQQKDNPIFVATYAYSLHLQKRNAESLRLMRQLKPEQLEQPNIAGYYGLILATAGDKTSAKKYLDLAAKARLLPEEAELFRRVKL